MNRKLYLVLIGLTLASFAGLKAQVASFTATPTSGCNPLPVTFTNQSTGATSWLWDFGDGATSVAQNPTTHVYLTPAVYTAKLTVNGVNTFSQTITVNPSPVANFKASDSSGCFPLAVDFIDLSTTSSGAITSWNWDFGDGNTTTGPAPSHVYKAASNFPVSLKVTNSSGCTNALTKPAYIVISNGVTADFTNSAVSACKVPITVNFTNISTGPPTISYTWSFGDGNSSTQPNPTNSYNAAGTFIVTLVAQSTAGCTDTMTKSIPISGGGVQSSFTAPDSICVGSLVNFQNTSVPNPTISSWDFGDGSTSPNISPSKTYSTAGSYTVKLINTFGACIDSVSKPIKIIAPLVADFTANNTVSCNTSFAVNFQDQSVNANSWSWNFGDGGTSINKNPSHTYATYGLYDVSLTVTNAAGCTVTVTHAQYIQVVKPVAKITNLPYYGCAPLTFTPVLNDSLAGGIVSYLWDYGDGSTSTAANPPPHVYATAGVYVVNLTLTGVTCSVSTTDTVKVGTIKPIPDFSASPTTICVNKPVTFTDMSGNSPNQWLWDFGDGTFSNTPSPVHSYTKAGTFSVKLIAYNNGCNDSASKINYIIVNLPQANFSYTSTCVSNLTQYSFTDASLGADTWTWDFGDGSPQYIGQTPPTHVFPSSATSFIVTLTVTNATTGCTDVKKLTVASGNAQVDFIASVFSSCKNTSVFFTILTPPANLNPNGYFYNYGDGVTDGPVSSRSSGHVYTKAGTYSVTVTITGANGCLDSLTKTNYVTITGPTSGFTIADSVGCTSLNAVFTDQSTSDGVNNIVNWTWDYGDGSVPQAYSAPPFTHIYSKQGIYSVKLKVTDAGGCSDSIIKTNLISVSFPKAIFSTVDSLSCPGSPIQFSNTSSGYGLTYNWDFGDGSNSSSISPAPHLYAIGTYIAQLKIVDQFGCADSLSTHILIDTPSASFTLSDSLASCPPLQAVFTFTGHYNKSLNWTFGDGGTATNLNPIHFYVIPGTYTAGLTVTSHGGCTATAVTKTITIFGPYGALHYSPLIGCHTLAVNFNVVTSNVVKYVWDFNNGQTQTTTVPSVSYTYDSAGSYVPLVILQDSTGCNVPVNGTDTILVIGSKPGFTYDKNIFCGNGTVQFTDTTTSTGTIANYAWDFGDGGVSTAKSPSHFYAGPGSYTVKLVVTAQTGCQDSIIQTNLVKVVANPTVDINGAVSQCVPAVLNFQGVEVVTDTSALVWTWNFYNGQNASLQTPPAQTYNAAGSDSVQLIATNSTGCSDTVKKYFTIYPLPLTNAGADTTICLGQNAPLNATGAATYNWLPPNSDLSCTNCANPIATPVTTTSYVVTGTSAFNCMQNDTVVVTVIQPQSLGLSSTSDSICTGQTVTLNASGETLYTWTPSTGLDNPNIANPVASPDTTTIYRVVGTDSKFCFSDTQYVKVSVFSYPTINAGPDVTVPIGSSYQVNGIASADVDSIIWTPSAGLSCTTCLSPLIIPTTTTTYIVKVFNSGGCSAADSLNIISACDNKNLFVPNTFSPNGDGVNDWFYVRGKGLNNVQSIRIFDRWGQLVFEKKNFAPNVESAGWDGTFHGKPAPIDVYIYTLEVICENSVVVPYHGNVALIR